jgi:hypothetical protein
MNRVAVAGVALTFGIAGCHTTTAHRSGAIDPSVLVARAAALHTAAGNRTATVAETRRLLALAPVPSEAQTTSQRPTGLAGPALGTPLTSSLIDTHRYWYVGQPVESVWAYVKAHRPASLRESGSSSALGQGSMTSEGLAWSEPEQGYASDLQLDVSLAPAAHGHGTVIRADGMGEWLDPRPNRDVASGDRMRVSAADPCPRSDRGMVGVTSGGGDLSKRLLPDTQPTGALICEYGGMNISPAFSLGASARLDAQAANQLAKDYLRLPIAHTDGGVSGCPADDSSINVIALSYQGRSDVDLWAKANGCAVVRNGHIAVSGRVDLTSWIAPLKPGG